MNRKHIHPLIDLLACSVALGVVMVVSTLIIYAWATDPFDPSVSAMLW